jgi:probable O-glycosylation ligase (exosortase A-associated)
MRSLALLTLFLVYLPPVFVQPFCGILLWTWFSIMNPHRLVWGIGAGIPYAMIIALVTLGAWLASKEPKTPPRSAVTFALIGLMVTTTLSTAFALWPEAAFDKWQIVIKTLFMCVLTLTLLNNKVRLHAFIWVMVISLGYFGLKGGIFTITTGGSYRVYGPEASYITDNNHLALALVMAVPLMHFLQLQSKLYWIRLGLIVLQLLSLLAALASYSRGGLLAMLAMAILFWWRSPKKIGLAILAAVMVAFVFAYAPAQWFDRMNTISTYEEDSSAMSRIAIWKAGLQIASHFPILGGGFRATYSQAIVNQYAPGTEARAVHNSHLELLIENGALGFFFHLLLLGSTWFSGQRVRKITKGRSDLRWSRDLAAMLQTSLVGYMVGGTFLSLGYYDGWYNLAIAMAALHVVTLRQAGLQPKVGTVNSEPESLRPISSVARSFRRT